MKRFNFFAQVSEISFSDKHKKFFVWKTVFFFFGNYKKLFSFGKSVSFGKV